MPSSGQALFGTCLQSCREHIICNKYGTDTGLSLGEDNYLRPENCQYWSAANKFWT